MRRKFSRIPVLLVLFIMLSCGQSDQESNSVHSQAQQQEDQGIDAPGGVLPLTASPGAYQLELHIDPREDSFRGRATINILLNEPAEGIWLHGKDLRVKSLTVTDNMGQKGAAGYEQILTSGVSRVDFGRVLDAGDIVLEFDYEADFDTNLSGLFKIGEQGDFYALAKSESIQARKFLPGFDQPRFKSSYRISMTVPEGYEAISNTPELSRQAAGDGFQKIIFAPGRPTATYLLSIAVGPFDILDAGTIPPNDLRPYEVPLRGIARRGKAGDLGYVMSVTPRLVEIFEQALQQPYPFRKLDIVAAPQWPSGATELSAAITYREQRILLGDNPAPGARLAMLRTHAHEIAHMWFGNLVTPPWWDDLWLKEGFATWSTPMALTQLEPDSGHDLDALLRNFGAMSLDSLATTRAIREPIKKNENIRNAYDSITYSKSQAVIHMVDSYFGAESFRKALGQYVAQFSDGIAASEQFYQSIGEQTGEAELTDTFRQFVEQKGVPLLQVDLQCDAEQETTVTLRQSRYRPLGSIIEDGTGWQIPVCVSYAVEGERDQMCGLVGPDKNSLTLNTRRCPDWFMPNSGGNGYFRWNTDAKQWQGLLDVFSELQNGEQIALLDSAIAGFEAGTIDLQTMLRAVEYSSQSPLRQIVTFPLDSLDHYLEKVIDPEQAVPLRSQLTSWYLDKLATLETPADDNEALLKNRLLDFMALSLKHQPTRTRLADQALEFMAADGKPEAEALSSDLYLAAFTSGVQDLGKSFFDQLIGARNTIDDPLFDEASAGAMGAFRDASLVEQAHHYAMSEHIGARESFAMIGSMLREPGLQEIHWQWYKASLSEILGKIPSQWRRHSPRFAGVFCDLARVPELEGLFARHGDAAPGYELALSQTREQISLCVALRTNYRR